MPSTINVLDLEDKIFQLIGKKKFIIIEDLEDKISVYELFHLLVLYDDFTKIEVYDIDTTDTVIFPDRKYKIETPNFKIKKRGDLI